MIKAERYGGGHRWHCTNCDTNCYVPGSYIRHISWTNSYPPAFCTRCSAQSDESKKDAARAAIQRLKSIYEERAVFPGSIRAIADLCVKHGLLPTGMKKTHFARIINEVSK